MIIQTVQTIDRTSGETTSTSYIELETSMRCSITPKFSNSKLLITATLGATAYNNSGTDCSFYHKLYDVTNSADIANSESPSRFIDYGGSGIMNCLKSRVSRLGSSDYFPTKNVQGFRV